LIPGEKVDWAGWKPAQFFINLATRLDLRAEYLLNGCVHFANKGLNDR